MTTTLAIVFIFVGWLLGLLGPKIIDAIGKGYRRRELRRILSVELTAFKKRLLGIADTLEHRPEGTRRGLSQMRFGVPFLESQIPSLTLFSEDFQQRSLELILRIQNLNLLADSGWFYLTKTFDSPIESVNLAIAKRNAEETYRWIGSGARELADLVGQLLSLKG